ncbi:hypothetical protein BD626DRAFT_489580 [Schizophyllum amplum]|uniref:Uncharacterized protein n=1 Tax=Schizophyllum amplum TaxID=97359 RepID=A0A550CIU0_9AGAR|nr:hypothetical protein BD626DRAFT_489580 [Auriculariopsis ampla]
MGRAAPRHATGVALPVRPVAHTSWADRVRNLLMNERVQARLPNTNAWITGVVISMLQYFDVIDGDGYDIPDNSRSGWQVELFSPENIR